VIRLLIFFRTRGTSSLPLTPPANDRVVFRNLTSESQLSASLEFLFGIFVIGLCVGSVEPDRQLGQVFQPQFLLRTSSSFPAPSPPVCGRATRGCVRIEGRAEHPPVTEGSSGSLVPGSRGRTRFPTLRPPVAPVFGFPDTSSSRRNLPNLQLGKRYVFLPSGPPSGPASPDDCPPGCSGEELPDVPHFPFKLAPFFSGMQALCANSSTVDFWTTDPHVRGIRASRTPVPGVVPPFFFF